MLCRPDALRRHGPSNDFGSPAGLEDKQIRALRMELRSCRLNGSGMNKIARTRPATLFSINRRSVHVQSYNRCGSLAVMPAETVFDATEAELGVAASSRIKVPI
jgi:hypothetical protein